MPQFARRLTAPLRAFHILLEALGVARRTHSDAQFVEHLLRVPTAGDVFTAIGCLKGGDGGGVWHLDLEG